MTETKDAPKSYWFVGASYGGTEDQTSRFLSEGIWENGYDDKHLDLVRSMQPGDRIATKSTLNLQTQIVLRQPREPCVCYCYQSDCHDHQERES